MTAYTLTTIETRVRLVYKEEPFQGPKTLNDWGELDDVYPDYADDVAANSWLMENCIVWVETRKVTKTPWEANMPGEIDCGMCEGTGRYYPGMDLPDNACPRCKGTGKEATDGT